MLFNIPPRKPRPQAVVVLTDNAVRSMFARARVILSDGPVPVEGVVVDFPRHKNGLLNAVVKNPLTGARFLYGPDLSKGGRAPRLLAKL